MSAIVDRFMANARMRLPGALDDAIKHEVFNVLDEFCKNTNAWQEKISVPVVPTDLEYELESEDNRAAVIRLLGVDNNGIPIAATLPQPENLVLGYPPSVASTYTATVALTVVDPVSENLALPDIPDWFFVLYSGEFLDGLLARMMSQPAKPYTSSTFSLYHGRRFRNGMSRVRVAIEHQNLQGAQRWAFPGFACQG